MERGPLWCAGLLCGLLAAGGCGGDSEAQSAGGLWGGEGADNPEGFGNPGKAGDSGGAGGSGDGLVACGVLRATVRDFQQAHPDFEGTPYDRVMMGTVRASLGADGKPVADAAVAQANGVQAFDQWYRDTPGVNEAFDHDIALQAQGDGRFVFDSNSFFPVDDRGFGNEGNSHNFHFTTEIHTRFTYRRGDRFTFAGDDDVWIFINGRLAIDLGGVHQRAEATVDLDASASELGITAGQAYPLDVFHAERHTVDSNFRIETTIECLQAVVI